jgi:hypothetical protein
MSADKSTSPNVSAESRANQQKARLLERKARELEALAADPIISFEAQRGHALQAASLRTQAKALRKQAKTPPPSRHRANCTWAACGGCGAQIDPRSLTSAQRAALRYLASPNEAKAMGRAAPRRETMSALLDRGLVAMVTLPSSLTKEGAAVLAEIGPYHLAQLAEEQAAPKHLPGCVLLERGTWDCNFGCPVVLEFQIEERRVAGLYAAEGAPST